MNSSFVLVGTGTPECILRFYAPSRRSLTNGDGSLPPFFFFSLNPSAEASPPVDTPSSAALHLPPFSDSLSPDLFDARSPLSTPTCPAEASSLFPLLRSDARR